jgi:hypothetical protein
MGVMLALRSLPGEAGGAEGYWSRVFDGDEEQVLLACLAQIDAFATVPPIEKLDDETEQVVVVSGGSLSAAVLLYDAGNSGGWTRYVSAQSNAAWTRDGARRLGELLPDGLDEVRYAIRALLSGDLPPRPERPRRARNDLARLAAFREQAERYCALIESASTYGRGELVEALSTLLAELYRAGLALNGGASPDGPVEPHGPTADEWQARFASIAAVLDDWGSYHTTPCPRGANADAAIELPVASPLTRVWASL